MTAATDCKDSRPQPRHPHQVARPTFCWLGVMPSQDANPRLPSSIRALRVRRMMSSCFTLCCAMSLTGHSRRMGSSLVPNARDYRALVHCYTECSRAPMTRTLSLTLRRKARGLGRRTRGAMDRQADKAAYDIDQSLSESPDNRRWPQAAVRPPNWDRR